MRTTFKTNASDRGDNFPGFGISGNRNIGEAEGRMCVRPASGSRRFLRVNVRCPADGRGRVGLHCDRRCYQGAMQSRGPTAREGRVFPGFSISGPNRKRGV